MVHADHLKQFHADGPPLTWGEGIGNESEQSNDRSGMDNGNLLEDDAENLLDVAEQCDDTNKISRRPVRKRRPPAHLADYHLEWPLYMKATHDESGKPFLFSFQRSWMVPVCVPSVG